MQIEARLLERIRSVVAQTVKASAYDAGDLGSIPGLGRSPGEGKVYPLQYPGLENPMGCIVLGVAKSRSELSDFHFHFHSQFTKQENDSLEMFTQHKPVRARGGLHGLFSGCWILNCLSSLIVSTRWPRSKGV